MTLSALTALLTELRLSGLRDALLRQEQQIFPSEMHFHDRLYLLLEA